MNEEQKNQIMDTLKKVQDAELQRDIVALGMIKGFALTGKSLLLKLEASISSKQKETMALEIKKLLKEACVWIEDVNIEWVIPSASQDAFKSVSQISGIGAVIAVASGKGGVGKSTVCVNLAFSLKAMGFRVGIMDGDIYGPNIPIMLGVSNDVRPQVNSENKMIPIEAHGIKMISMGVLVPADQAMVWRGPMLHSAVTQFFQKVAWGELDFLLVDLPPGTGDVQLSLVQNTKLLGAVIVTTPQEVALMDVRKGVMMFKKTEVPVLGVVENMAGDVFGSGGGEKAASEFQVPFLGRIPLEAKIREGGDSGVPVIISEASKQASEAFQKVANNLKQQLDAMTSATTR